jgi:hypothetical protein
VQGKSSLSFAGLFSRIKLKFGKMKPQSLGSKHRSDNLSLFFFAFHSKFKTFLRLKIPFSSKKLLIACTQSTSTCSRDLLDSSLKATVTYDCSYSMNCRWQAVKTHLLHTRHNCETKEISRAQSCSSIIPKYKYNSSTAFEMRSVVTRIAIEKHTANCHN